MVNKVSDKTPPGKTRALPPPFSIDSFKSIFDGGARAYLFRCLLKIPRITAIDEYIYVKSTSLPGSDIDEHVLTYNGFDYKVHGKRTYSDWSVTLISDKTYDIRSKVEGWMNRISCPMEFEDEKINYAKIGEELETQTFMPLNYDGSDIKKISLIDSWPKSVGPIEFDYSNQDMAQFEVTFSYKYYIM
jgi:hypothetical protein